MEMERVIGSADVALHLALGRRSNVPPASRGLGDMVSLLTCQMNDVGNRTRIGKGRKTGVGGLVW